MTQNENTGAARRRSAGPNPRLARQAGPPMRQFPQIEKIYEGGAREALMRGIEATCRRLVEQAHSGDQREQERAQAALAAYGRTLELIRELDQVREGMATTAGNK